MRFRLFLQASVVAWLLATPIAIAEDAPAADVKVKLDLARAAVKSAMDAIQQASDAHQLVINQAVVVAPPVPKPVVPVATITVVPAPPLPPTVPLDLTNVALSLIAGIFSILGIVLPIIINARIKDKQAAATLDAAIANSLGAGEQAAKGVVIAVGPKITLPAGVPPSLLPNIQYVFDHAGPEAARWGITPLAIASKISARLGLAARAKETAVAVAVATSVGSPSPTAPASQYVPTFPSPTSPLA